MARKRDLQLAESLLPEVQKVQAELLEPEALEEMSLAEYNNEKKFLEARRKHLSLVLDKKRLNQAERIMNHMEMILDRIGEGYAREIVSAMDLKFLTDSYLNMQKALERVARLDSLDEKGTAARLNIEVRFEGY